MDEGIRGERREERGERREERGGGEGLRLLIV
jgi:hypothetical protein